MDFAGRDLIKESFRGKLWKKNTIGRSLFCPEFWRREKHRYEDIHKRKNRRKVRQKKKGGTRG